ncbi:KpsF/GutQ family sugar-phosphate isomerase [Litorimonas haliclonae]|uniref:KpsF/GutQ family sugar-phosphate isomerase n=1 Tax=Litorimonas haliclonae TaxID=2081977 RepID=UPI0039EFF9D8
MNTPTEIAEFARNIVRQERDALSSLLESIDTNTISQAVEIIMKSEGYLIVAGVGKSGHVGQKLAASFASTGTPAFFMHPTEASHGDLGMIAKGSTLLALSNSGESRELVDVLDYAKKEKVKVIALTSRPNSTLAKAATVTLLLPQVAEACPNGLAPTTSTTNTLAMGDALVVSVMQKRGFTTEDFGRRHPGGKLGLRLQKVSDWMDRTKAGNPLIDQNADMTETVLAITEGGLGCVGITDENGGLIGIVTDGDLRRAMGPNLFEMSATDIMTPGPFTVSKEQRMGTVVDEFTARRIGNAFVVQDGKPLALVDLKSLLAAGYV